MLDTVVVAIISGVFGGAGLAGLFGYFVKRYFDKKLGEEELKEKTFNAYRTRKAKLDRELQQAQYNVLCWMHRAIITGVHNGDLQKAFDSLQKAEEAKDDLEQEILVSFEQQKK